MQIYCYDGDLFTDFEEAIKGNGKLRALSILFEVKKKSMCDYQALKQQMFKLNLKGFNV